MAKQHHSHSQPRHESGQFLRSQERGSGEVYRGADALETVRNDGRDRFLDHNTGFGGVGRSSRGGHDKRSGRGDD
jgi:hypothetical protein